MNKIITTEGKAHIKRYLAGWTPVIGASLAFGLGGKAEAVGDTALQFEVGRSAVTLTSYDFINNKLIFKAPVPEDFGGIVYEVGLFSAVTDIRAGIYGSRIIATFDSAGEAWVNPATGLPSAYTTAAARIGSDALVLSPATSGTASALLDGTSLDFGGDSGADKVLVAYNTGANISLFAIQFRTDASNYYSFTVNSPTAGYQISSLTKGAAVATGSPNWSAINSIVVYATATGGGAGSITFDGLRIEDYASQNPDYVMVSRELLAAPFTKVDGMTQEIEFALDVAV